MRSLTTVLLLAFLPLGCSPSDPAASSPGPAPAGMVWVPGGEFTMGSVDPLARPDERPPHRVRVAGFWMDEAEVTNAQFAAFVAATGYRTVAERPVDWEELRKQVPPGTPKPPDSQLQPGALVFTPPSESVDLDRFDRWWSWTPGACWNHPAGPGSTIEGKEQEPVVHVAFEDAQAYARWAGKRLPTEAEWEYAARGGLEGKRNTWGDEPIDPRRANTWQGHFPDRNTGEDGFVLAAPVRSFPPNGFGLFDMAGNVWEWCSDPYRPYDGAETPVSAVPGSLVVRGGSFLCNDAYCSSYRPSARMSQTPDTGMQHLGFRCVRDAGSPRLPHRTEP